MADKLWAVIPAAGYGVRAGFSIPKQFVNVAGRTILEWTVLKVLSLPEVSGVVIALPRECFEDVKGSKDCWYNFETEILKTVEFRKPLITVPGGASRQESVFLALMQVPPEATWVMVHDAARPLFSAELFRRVFEEAKRFSAAVCAVNAVDTIKAITNSVTQGKESGYFVEATLDRQRLVMVQTPQIFRADILRNAHEIARRDGYLGTDDSQLVERLGWRVRVVPGERSNVKVTFPEDFQLFKMLLDQGKFSVPGDSKEGISGFKKRIPGSKIRFKRRFRRLDTKVHIPVTGIGFDIHPLVFGRRCILGGVDIPFEKGLLGHSDADVLCHALMDALLGATALGDIGKWFPQSDPRYEGANSLELLKTIWEKITIGAKIVHIDCTIIAEEPKISPYIDKIKQNLSEILSTGSENISIKATTAERLGVLGRAEGIACLCAVTLLKKGGFFRGS